MPYLIAPGFLPGMRPMKVGADPVQLESDPQPAAPGRTVPNASVALNPIRPDRDGVRKSIP